MNRWNVLLPLSLVLSLAAPTLGPGGDDEEDAGAGWPREIQHPQGTVIIYQPQPESFKGNMLKARAAISVQMPGEEEPHFGAFWVDARVETDREAGDEGAVDVGHPGS